MQPRCHLKVLFAEADAEWHRQAAALLEPQGVEAVQARTGREALKHLERGEVHVAVLDQNLPQLNGLQVVKLARSVPAAPPSILLADDLSPTLLHEALGMQVFSVLTKPVDLNLLLQVLARVVKRRYEGKWPTA